MCKNYTVEQFHEIANRLGLEWLGRDTVDGRRHLWRCKCGYEWATRVAHVRNGHTCPSCSGMKRKTKQDYLELAKNRGFTWIDADVSGGVLVKQDWICSKNHRFSSTYSDVKAGYGCAECAGVKRKTPEMYKALGERTGFKWIGTEVKGVFHNTDWLCPKNHKFSAPYHMLDIGRGCPICKESRYERLIGETLSAWGIPYEREKTFPDCKWKSLLRFDFYISSINVLIEFQGPHHKIAQEQWSGERGLLDQQEKDRIKREFAESSGIHLIEIDYTTEDIPGYMGIEISKKTGIPYRSLVGKSKISSSRSKLKGVVQRPLFDNMIDYLAI